MREVAKMLVDIGEEDLADRLLSASSSSAKEFFSIYAKVSRKIRKIKKLKGDEKSRAEELLGSAVDSLKQLNELLS